MSNEIIKVEGSDSLGREVSSGAIVATNSDEIKNHLERRKREASNEQRIKNLEEEVCSLKEQINQGFLSIIQAINNKNS